MTLRIFTPLNVADPMPARQWPAAKEARLTTSLPSLFLAGPPRGGCFDDMPGAAV